MSSTADSDDEYDLSLDSSASTGAGSSAPGPEVTEDNAGDLMHEFCDDLTDKSAEKRVRALAGCARVLALRFWPEVTSVQTTLLEAVESSLKRGGDGEKQAAIGLLQLVLLTIGTESPGLYGRFRPVLAKLIKDGDGQPATQAQLVSAFAMLSFVSDDSGDDIEDDVALLAGLFESSESVVCSAGVAGWSLLLTTLSADTIVYDYLEEALLQLAEMLPGADLLKSAAVGEAIAYLLEVAVKCETYDAGDLPIDAHDIAATLDDLANERSRKTSKHEQKGRRKKFRVLARAVRSGSPPAVALVINKQEVRFDNWEQIIQLGALRAALRSGFQTHMHHNDLLHQIFDIRLAKEVSAHKLSRLEKRFYCSKNSASSRDRSESRAAARDKKHFSAH